VIQFQELFGGRWSMDNKHIIERRERDKVERRGRIERERHRES